MKETVVEFGPSAFVGILTRPENGGALAPADVAVLITNAGIIHRVGPNRLHVRLARFLAAQGYPCLRYDLPGIGDSEAAGAAQVAEARIAATRSALDRLERMGVARRFIILGICSGADHSLVASVFDPRLVGAVVIDPTTVFATPRHRVNRTLQRASRLLVPRVLWRVLTGRTGLLRRITGPAEPPIYGMPRAPGPEEVDTRNQAVGALRALCDRRVQLYMIMTGHSNEVFSYREQMVDAFPELPALKDVLHIDRWPTTGHTFGREADRNRLEGELVRWLRSAPFPLT